MLLQIQPQQWQMIKVPIVSFLLSYAEIGSLLLSLAGRQSRTEATT